MRSAFLNPSQAPTPPLRRAARAGKGESARLLPKDICGCQRSAPRTARSRRGDNPASPRGKEPVPEGTKIRIAAARPVASKHHRLAQRRHQPARKEQPLRCRKPDLALKSASFKAPLEHPRREPPFGGCLT